MLIQSESIDELSNNLNHQQLFLYQIKNFDQEVEGYMEKLKLKGRNLSEVIQQLPENEQMRFYELLGEFEQTVKEMQFYKEKCQTLLQTKLYTVNKKLAQFDLKKDKVTYGQDGKETEKLSLPKTFEKSI